MPVPLLALSLIGTGISAYSQFQSSKNQAKAMRAQALLDIQNADELLRRSKVRNKIFEEQGIEFQANQATAIQKKGIDSGSGTALLLLEETSDRIKEQIIMNNKETAFDQSIARLNAQQLINGARDTEMAGILSALGTASFGAAQAGRSAPGRGISG